MKRLISILFILIITTGISGCTINPEANGTFGEKKPSLVSDLSLINSTGTHYTYNGTQLYSVEGYLHNNYGEDASNVKIQAIFYDKNAKIVATNDSAYINPKVISGNGNSYYYIDTKDPENKIVKYEIKILDVQ